MALKKCKECGEEISTKAEACPKCGAKRPKKTSVVTWFILFLIIAGVFAASQNDSPSYSATNASSSTVDTSTKKAPPPKPAWSTSTSKNEMTGKVSWYASSPIAYPKRKMDFPYGDVHGWLGVGCDAKDEWVYFGFNSQPNLTNDETKDGYNLVHTRVKWDNQISNVALTQKWGAKFIHFKNDKNAISKIAASNNAMLELQWHGQQPAFLDFTLKGSSKAIKSIRNNCSKL